MKNSVHLFVRKDYRKSDGSFPIYLRLIIASFKKDYSTGISVPNPELFDTTKQQIKGIKYSKENTVLFSIKNRADEILLSHILKNIPLTFIKFDQLFKENKICEDSFYDFAMAEISLMEGTVSDGYIKQLKSEINKLKGFKKLMKFGDISLNFIQKYEQYMRNELSNKTNTVGKTLKKVKMLFEKAIKKGFINKNPFDDYKIKEEPSNRIFLSIEEVDLLQKIYDSNCLVKHHQNVLRYFLFSCYTGLRFGDLVKFGPDKIERHSNDLIINLIMEKTNDTVRIPLIKKALNLINDNMANNKPLFKIYTGQVSNRFLKEIIKFAGINKKICFHCSRHTFATIALTIGIPIEVVSKLLGHTDIKTTQIYAKVIDTLKIEQMKKFNNI